MTLNAWTGNPDADSYSQNNKPKCTAADGKTEVHNMPGVGLVVSAAAFNALVRERDEADRRAGAAERRLGNCMNDVRRFEIERSQMKTQEKQS